MNSARALLIKRLFPNGIPTLWCPPLTHYEAEGGIDQQRIEAHLQHLAPHAKGLLVPGSTGDGWDLSPEERRRVLEIVLEQAVQLNLHVLIGALQADPADAISLIREDISWLKKRTGETDTAQMMAKAHVCGFTVCPSRGQERTQQEIRAGLAAVLELGLPTALYQLPQMTRNEMSPETVAELAGEFSNFIFFKDSSGADRVALSGQDLDGVFTTRGGEGDYEKWLKSSGGPYSGFLLGSSNCFAPELAQVIRDLDLGRTEAARELSVRVTAVVREVAKFVRGRTGGNSFAQANKAIDHYFAHGPCAARLAPPRLHDRTTVPADIVAATGGLLTKWKLMPQRGYLQS
jgi:dihydrodipicolinate synthase/N-acetylneuraminate lyase